MSGTLVFNHHSLPFDQRTSAINALPGFLKTCLEAKNAGLATILVDESVDSSWFRLELASGYYFQDWYATQQAAKNQDELRAFRAIATQQPFFSPQDFKDGAKDLFEVTYEDNSYTAISAAAWHSAPVVSFETREPWIHSPMYVQIQKINPENCEVIQENTEIPNYYNYAVFEQDLSRIILEREASLRSGQDVLTNAVKYYPQLEFCGKAKQQLGKWSAGTTLLNQVKKSLFEFNSFAEKWQAGQYSFYSSDHLRESGMPYAVSGESSTVHNTPALQNERLFYLPSGIRCFFEEHVKLSNGFRIHFYPNHEDKKIYVAYIGPHLTLS